MVDAAAPTQGLSVTLEPLYVVFALLFTLWTTRTWPSIGRCAERHPPPAAHASLLGALVAKAPFVAELGRFVGILILYRISAWVCYMIWGLDSSQALANAWRIVRLQTFFFVGDIERNVQAFAWAHPYVMIFLNRVYKHCHIPGTVTFLCFLFISDRNLYRRWILPFSVVNVIAFVVFALYPCTPPRLIPSLHIIDTMHSAPYGLVNEFQDTRFANQHAAVPSMHIGWSTFVTCGLALALCRRKHRRQQQLEEEQRQQCASVCPPTTAAVAEELREQSSAVHAGGEAYDDLPTLGDAEFWRRYGPLTEGNRRVWYACSAYSWTVLISVMATGNHFLMDAVAGLAAATLAYYLTRPSVYGPVLYACLGVAPSSPLRERASEPKELPL